ncbi:ATP-binding cassette domain-containing protein [Propioniferax innocua]|uniref:Peptide/nickel transport system ATP-binding protein n=1 Tax=Propioniferax innocua TaxID=1753 RepID=A0A542ZS78_9ACTN|nr:ABC transporter ATP-binding protein [Propioniferax innocua]TQL63177.1 peptide/nickel transport system ATP-binding protein [Propioniferax innocua]
MTPQKTTPRRGAKTRTGSGAPMVEGSAWHTRVAADAPVLEVEDLEISTTAAPTQVIVSGVDLSLRPSEILALVGESGSGKTTVALAVLGHFREGLHRTAGSVTLHASTLVDPVEMTALDREVRRGLRGSRVAYIPQDPASSLNPSMRVGEQIREVLDIHAYGDDDAARAERVRDVLREVGLPDDDAYQRRWPHQLSGGQQQRIGIAMAFAMHPDVLVLDEPTTGLDVTTQALVLDTVRDLTIKHRVAALYITHDLAVVNEIADRVMVMQRGEVVEVGPVEQVLHDPQHPYSRTLIAAVPDLAGRNKIWEFEQRRRAGEFDPAEADDEPAESTANEPGTGGKEARVEVNEPARTTEAAHDDGVTLSIEDLRVAYGSNKVLKGIDLELQPAQTTLLLGESGSGKTTMARSIAGLNANWTGTIRHRGEALERSTRRRAAQQRKAIQYVFQSPYSSLNPRRTLEQSLSVPLEMTGEMTARQRRERVGDALDAVRLGREFARRRPGDLSGGERQRAAIARALVNMPEVLVCDEITSALDVSVQASIIDLLVRLREERGMTMLFVTHNIALARHIASRVAVLQQGVIVDEGTTEEILTNPTADYTKELLENAPDL